MRDAARIDTFCAKLAEIWKKVPNWRFGQLMMNCLGEMSHLGRDPFFPEDDEMISFIEKYIGQVRPTDLAHNRPFDHA